MKKIIKSIIILFTIMIIYFGTLFILRLNPKINLSKNDNCISQFNYEIQSGIHILEFDNCNSYENGKFHGKKLKNEIKEMVNFLKNDMLLGGGDKYLGYPIYSILQYKAKNFIKYIPKENLEEIQGIADGAEVNFNDILLINTYDDMLQIAGCSSMIIPKKKGYNDYFIHTRNLDYPIKILAKNKVVLKYNSYISVGFPGYIGVLTGIGYNGISLSSHTAYSKNRANFGIPSGLLYRKILLSKDIEGAKNILETNKITIANNLMIGDYKKNIGIVAEFDVNDIAYRDFENETILVSTNHFRTKKMKEKSRSFEGLRYGQYFEKIRKLKNINININDIKKILGYYKNTKGWTTISNNGTIQSVIMIPELKKMFIANGEKIPVTNGEYIEINF